MPYTDEDFAALPGMPPALEGAASAGYRVALLPAAQAALEIAFRVPEEAASAGDAVGAGGDAAGAELAALGGAGGAPGAERVWLVYQSSGGAWVPLPSAPRGEWIVAAAHGAGFFRLALADSAAAFLPRTAALHPNAPNPFNPSTTLRYDVPPPGARVLLEVYSIEGRLVRRLDDRFAPPGRYETRWDGRDDGGRTAASGIYFLRYVAGPAAFTRKMTLLR
jgi:hypothetical protein